MVTTLHAILPTASGDFATVSGGRSLPKPGGQPAGRPYIRVGGSASHIRVFGEGFGEGVFAKTPSPDTPPHTDPRGRLPYHGSPPASGGLSFPL